jgi:mannobiose 2-epimerase
MYIHIRKKMVVFISILLFIFSSSCFLTERTEVKQGFIETKIEKNTIISELRKVLDDEFKLWYPLSIDTSCGGFLSDINYKWQIEDKPAQTTEFIRSGEQNKMIVTQARHVWSAANAAMFYQKDNMLRSIAAHGLAFLRDKMWDREFGGFYNLVTRSGEPIREGGQVIKQAYGNAFAIYGLAAYYRTSGDTSALRLAQEGFHWLEEHSYDHQYGGYFQFISREGIPFKDGYENAPPKDYNSMIHLLECLIELYKVWPDEQLRERLYTMMRIIRDSVTTDKGYMILYFNRDWTPVSYRDSSSAIREKNYEYDHVSFGHDVETAYLILEASKVLDIKDDTVTLQVAKKMVDHALKYGWDQINGGIYDWGYYYRGEHQTSIIRNTKEWWSQAEALNSFLIMSDLFPQDELNYYGKFCIQWNYCKKYLIDQEYGGWYWGGVDIVPSLRYFPKGTIWKCNYHTSRALINCINRLNSQTMTYGQRHYNPVNKNATPEAKKLLDYLYSINGKHIIAGHHSYTEKPDIFINRVKELTGKSPEIWGCDFIIYYKEGNAEQIVQEAYKKNKDGYIVTLMWHAGRPQDNPPFGWKESIQAEMTDNEWTELTTPGTELNSRWLKQVDTIAWYLNELQALGVPVLWRPYHELNGVWFWWGDRKGENGSAKLYKMMYDRFVRYHRLNNLIWVWNTNAPRQIINDEAYDYEDYFPGLDYVDVLAADVYHSDYRQSHHDKLVELGQGKLIALGEVGEVPSPEIIEHQPMWAWFMIWSNFVDTHNTPQQIRNLYNYPKILTHENFLMNK